MKKRIPVIIGLILLSFALWVQVTTVDSIHHFITRMQEIAYDFQLRAKLLTGSKSFQTDIVIIDIDDYSLNQIGRWPWSREKLAVLTDQIYKLGAVVVAYDLLLPEKERNIADELLEVLKKENLTNKEVELVLKKTSPYLDYDTVFAKSLASRDSVLGISFLSNSMVEGVLSSPLFELTTPEEKALNFISAKGVIGNYQTIQADAKSSGFINVFPDEDGIIRRIPVLMRYNDAIYPSLALEAVRLYLFSNVKLVTAHYGKENKIEGVMIGDYVIPTSEQAEVVIPFRGKSFTFPYYSAADVMKNQVPPHALEGKIVFVGTSATGLGDLKATAIQNIFPGVEVHATIADGILKHNFSYQPAWSLGVELAITALLGFLCAILFPLLGPRVLLLLILVMPLSLISINTFIWNKTGFILSVFVPVTLTVLLALMNMIYGYLFESRRREKLKMIFGQYVPAKHIDTMLTAKEGYGLFGEDREMTVLFADIRNFTTISENLNATELKNLLNDFFTPMTEIIFNYRGTIDKYIGDLIMAFWGAPLRDKRHAQHAIDAALDMQHKVIELNKLFQEKGMTTLSIGIGINSGVMSVGDMGSKFRRNYTVLGDAVNLASRIESLSKYYHAKIVVTENTKKNQIKFLFRQLDRVRVKGKQLGVNIYEPVCRVTDASPSILEEINTHHEAMLFYFNQDWDKAYELFLLLQSKHPTNKLYEIYLKRIEEYQQSVLPKEWDGVFLHTTK